MPGSPFYSGLFEGFNTRRQKEYDTNLEAEAKARETEGNIYKYLLQSTDPQTQALAMAGLFESARPGTRAKGLRGFMGEVQGGEIYPQIMAHMNEQIPDTQAAPPATPQSAALPSTTPVHGGEMGAAAPTFQAPQAPEDITAALGMGAPESSFGAPGPGAPQAQAGMVGQPPPEHPTHRRGTGVPTAEEVADASSRRKQTELQAQVAAEHGARMSETQAQVAAEHAAKMAEIDETARVRELPIPPNDEDMQLPDGTVVPTRMTARGLVDARTMQPLPPGAHPLPKTSTNSLDQIIPPNELALLVDPRTGVNPPYGTTRREADALGLKIRTPDQRIRLAAIKEFVPMLRRAEVLLPQVFPGLQPNGHPASSGLAGRVESSVALAKQKVQGLQAYRELEGLLNVMKGPTAKIIAAESGRLTQQDIERAATMYPNIGMFADSPGVAQSMLQQFRGVVDDALVGMGEPPTNWNMAPTSPGAASSSAAPAAPSDPPAVGQVRQYNGQWVVIRGIYPDGTADIEPIQRLPVVPMVPTLQPLRGSR